ncbi:MULTISPECIES: hypothetical protein [Streptomyces]|uniref:Uncharacterized protein n=1 Tax=Streptomyces glycanivorans TaxID=3033808 RepID=A0ABY9JLH3_9ACTN|nr:MULTISPECIES: hypothetical protein [unclassified Streptomyces]WSQ81928.1 hypothetical protein OG725_34705 [Streptomyces sp. NBC_01213]TXS12535.1 hypothetical protein EAO68_22970 [Streptomyces sp. wa22]WLQ68571.1 hypothetical protein P8A20_35695 [Streptomyces sp. Alt3]WSQ89257.1 hypothetical protein OG722_35100 [Streptomyces sp. NBC_01212]WSR04736.1 hypothetical protein OG265_01400 [Streptomyces sp. NBC_01208]
MSASVKKRSRSRVYLSLGTTAFGMLSVVKQAELARKESDTLRLVDAVISTAKIVTGLAVLYRELKSLGDDDVLFG